jgi:hypothetical protein
MIWVKRVGVALFVGVALTLLPLFLPSLNSLGLLHEPMVLLERTFKSSIPLNAGKRLITLFLANVATWSALVVMLELSWCGVKGLRTSARW